MVVVAMSFMKICVREVMSSRWDYLTGGHILWEGMYYGGHI